MFRVGSVLRLLVGLFVNIYANLWDIIQWRETKSKYGSLCTEIDDFRLSSDPSKASSCESG